MKFTLDWEITMVLPSEKSGPTKDVVESSKSVRSESRWTQIWFIRCIITNKTYKNSKEDHFVCFLFIYDILTKWNYFLFQVLFLKNPEELFDFIFSKNKCRWRWFSTNHQSLFRPKSCIPGKPGVWNTDVKFDIQTGTNLTKFVCQT